MAPEAVHAILRHIGLIATNGASARESPGYHRQDGSTAIVGRTANIVREGPPPGADVPLVVQVSRWDALKDMAGVMQGFVEHVAPAVDQAHLALVGPDTAGVSDDPEGAAIFEDCVARWQALPPVMRERVSLVRLPMEDGEENAAMVNAIQRHAAVVVQKSMREGFGLTVTEAMWKGRPIVASAVGGIQDQLRHRKEGLLVRDPADLRSFGRALRRLLQDAAYATVLGEHARRRCIRHFLPPRHLRQYVELVGDLTSG
jgi:trehalose synthase